MENILTTVIYNILNTSVTHLSSSIWMLINAFILSTPEAILSYLELDSSYLLLEPSLIGITKEEILTTVIPPIFFIRNKVIDKIIKDILLIIYQNLIHLISSIITSRLRTLLTIGVLGLSITKPEPKIGKGKGKEVIKEDSEWDLSNDSSTSHTTDEDEGEYVYISPEKRKLLVKILIQKGEEDKMKQKNLAPNSSESEPIFKDPWETDPNHNLENSKFKMPRQIDTSHNLSDPNLLTQPQDTKNNKSDTSYNFSDEELKTLANHIIRRHKAKLEQSQQLTQSRKDLDTQSNPDTESFYVIAPTEPSPSSTSKHSTETETELDYGEMIVREDCKTFKTPVKRQNVPVTEERLKLKTSLPTTSGGVASSKPLMKRDKMLQIILHDRDSHTPTEDTQLRTPKTANLSDFNFEFETEGGSRSKSNKKVEITYYKLSDMEDGKLEVVQTTPGLKIDKKNKNKNNEE